LLLIEFSGSTDTVATQAELAAGLARENHALEIHQASDPDARAQLWRARHRAYYAGLKLRPGSRAVITDVCVPMSQLSDAVVEARDDLRQHGLIGPILGHVGDGNFHSTILVTPDNTAEIDAAEAAQGRMVARALAVGGTCTGEHGIGLGKRQYLEDERGRAIDLMRSIKKALDPCGIFNPGKML
jgi:D-lactate dehydrogenase (cytochrome)